MKKKLVFSGLLLLLFGMPLGCGGQSKELEAKSTEQESTSLEISVKSKEQFKIQPKKETEQTKPKPSDKRLEKKITKIVDKIEKYCTTSMDKGNMDAATGVDMMTTGLVHELVTIGTPSIPVLIDVVKDKKRHWYCRIKVFHLASIIDQQNLIEPLMEILEDKSEDSRVRVETLNCLVSHVGSKYLLGILKDESDTRVRIEILRGLGTYIGDVKAIDALVEALDDEDEIVAVVSVRGLGFIGGESVVEPLIDALRNNRHNLVRVNAPTALGNTKSKRAVEPLIEEVRRGNMWAPEALANLWKDGIHDDRIIEVLIEGVLWLKSEDKRKRDSLMPARAATALGEIGDKRAVESLIEALWATKGSGDSWCIIGALGEIGDKRAIEHLEKAFHDERYKNARNNIWVALQLLTGKEYGKYGEYDK